jgi:hypothetical protein
MPNSGIAESLNMTEGETTTTATTVSDQGDDDNAAAKSSWLGLLLTSLAGMAVLVLFMSIVVPVSCPAATVVEVTAATTTGRGGVTDGARRIGTIRW